MGFMRGVPFFWSLHLLPIMVLNVAVLLFVFYWLDRRAYRKDIAEGCKPDISKPGTEVKILGLHNLIFLVMIVAAVILSGVLPGMAAFQDEAGQVLGIRLYGEVKPVSYTHLQSGNYERSVSDDTDDLRKRRGPWGLI